MAKNSKKLYKDVHDTFLNVNLNYIALLLTFFTAITTINPKSFTIRLFFLGVFIVFIINLFLSEKVRNKAQSKSEFGSLLEKEVKSAFGVFYPFAFIIRRAVSIMIFALLILMIIWTFENQYFFAVINNHFLILLTYFNINFGLLFTLILIVIVYCIATDTQKRNQNSRKKPEN